MNIEFKDRLLSLRELFERDGYILVKDFFTYDEVQIITEQISRSPKMTAEKIIYSNEITVINDVVCEYENIRAIALNSKLEKLVEYLIDQKIEIQHSKILDKPFSAEGVGKIKIHQDFPFFPHTNFDVVAAVMHCDPVSLENGPLTVYPKSHKLGIISHLDESGNFGYQLSNTNILSGFQPVIIEAEITDLLVFHSLLVHSSGFKKQPSLRRNIYIEYRARDAVQLAGPIWKCTGLSSSNQNFARFARFPDGQRIELRGKNGRLYDLYGALSPDPADFIRGRIDD